LWLPQIISTTFIKFVNVGEQHPAILESLQLIHPFFPPSFNVLVYTHVNVLCIHEDSLPPIPPGVFNFISSEFGWITWKCLAVFPELQGRKNLPDFPFVSLAFRYNISKAVVEVAHLSLAANEGSEHINNEYFVKLTTAQNVVIPGSSVRCFTGGRTANLDTIFFVQLGQHSVRQNCLSPSSQLYMAEVPIGITFTVSSSQRKCFTLKLPRF
jgi:hypothetical protein